MKQDSPWKTYPEQRWRLILVPADLNDEEAEYVGGEDLVWRMLESKMWERLSGYLEECGSVHDEKTIQ